MNSDNNLQQTAVFAGGCFWCTEAIFRRVKGVLSVTSGYCGGKQENPSRVDVHTGNTGYAECVQIIYDQSVVSYDKLLEVFFATHDPTTINRQGHDEGAQYRSVIFYKDEQQKHSAEEGMARAQEHYKDLIVTHLEPHKKFYEAQEYHQNFYDKENDRPDYCRLIIDPKIKKLFKEFPDITKEDH
jgi:peptide-methionine (S)-S-oxide reductase